MIALRQICCGFSFLAGLLADKAALTGYKLPVSSAREREGKHCNRFDTAGTLVFCFLLALPFDASRAAEPVYDIDIPSMNAAEALNRLAEQTGAVMLFSYDLASAKRANAVRGRYTLLDGLELLLRDTGLSGGLSDKRVVIIAEEANMPAGKGKSMKKRGLLASIVAMLGTSAASNVKADQELAPTNLNEIIVTAQKREERLQDVPVPVSVVAAQDLINSDQSQLQDYYAQVPGLSFTLLGDVGAPVLTLRGVTTGGYNNPTVGVTVDDIPFGASSFYTYGATAPDFDPSELQQIEVLRGPQGTLYGASSLGGLVKFVTIAPSTEDVSAALRVGISSVENGDALGYSTNGYVNVPLGETLALRASGFVRQEAGYIDDPALGRDGVNQRDVRGVRLATRWTPSPAFELRLSALQQDNERRGENTVHLLPELDDLEQQALNDTGWYDETLEAYSATAIWNTGNVELTSLTGVSYTYYSSSLDAPTFATFTSAQFGVTGTRQDLTLDTEKLSQEFRATFPLSDTIDALVGVFYAQEESVNNTDLLAIDTTNGDVADAWYRSRFAGSYTEMAAFANLTFQLTERLDIQVGGRASEIEVEGGEEHMVGPFNTLFLGRQFDFFTPNRVSTDEPLTYLVTPRYRVTPNVITYARFGSGFRAGAPNPAIAASSGLPLEYAADTTENYEIGLKGDIFEGLLGFDASIYYIDWQDVQLQLRDPTTNQIYFANAAAAISEGVELSLQWSPFDGLMLSGWVAYNNAELSDVPTTLNVNARAGDQLPYSSPTSGAFSIDYDFDLANGLIVSIGGTVSYVDERYGRFFRGDDPRQIFPSYSQTDLRFSIDAGNWDFNGYVTNAMDERGVLRGGRDASLSLPYSFTYIQPRTIGVSVTRSF